MNRSGLCFLGLLALLAATSRTFALEAGEESELTTPPKAVRFSYEAEADYSLIGGARTAIGRSRAGKITEQSEAARLVVAPQREDGPIYRFGLDWQRASFGLPKLAPLPDALQSASVIIGMDVQLFNSWLVRIEAQPGFYSASDSLDAKDFNTPFLIGASYIAGPDLQWIIGIEVDVNRHYPLLGALGVRWKFADHWVLNAVAPSPRLEFEVKKDLTLYAGADLKGGTYRTSNNLGQLHDKRVLNDAILEYNEIRVGAGLSWKATPGVTLDLGGGYLPYREFYFRRAHLGYPTESGAPYGQASIHAAF